MIFFCCSNVTIPSVISFIVEKEVKEYLIITTSKEVYHALTTIIDESKIYYFKPPVRDIPNSFKNLFLRPLTAVKSVRENISLKNKFINFAEKNIRPNVIICFELYRFCDFEFWMVKSLRRKASEFIFLKNLHNLESRDIRLLDRLSYLLVNKLVFNTTLKPSLVSGMHTMSITNEYISSLGKFTQIDSFYNKNAIREFVTAKLPTVNRKDVVILTGGKIFGNFVEKDSYLLNQNTIIGGIKDFIGISNVVAKSHPVYEEYVGFEDELEKIPAYLPMNILGLDSYKIIIGLSSTVLIEASNNSKCTPISTAEIYFNNFKKPEFYPQIKSYLLENMNSENPILFPKTINELLNIVYRIKQ